MSTASESHSPARGNGLTGVLSKPRRGRNKNTVDTTSAVSNGSDASLNLRGKLGGTSDKLKNQDGSDDDGGGGGRLSKLIPKGIGSMRRRKKEDKEAEQRASEEAARGRSVAERGTLENDNGDYPTTADGDGSSLITYESENEEYVLVYFLHLLHCFPPTALQQCIGCLKIRALLRSAIQKRDSPASISPRALPLHNRLHFDITNVSRVKGAIAISLGFLA